MTSRDLIVSALLSPPEVLGYSVSQWDLLIRQGRRTRLLARLGYALKRANLIDKVPKAPSLHLLSAMQYAVRQDISLRWEVSCICREMAGASTKVTLLKGAAYAMAILQAAQGRSFSDIDIIVPKAKIAVVESELLIHGWQAGHHDEYDQRYYRQWMHEIPPLLHTQRGTTIDVHHAILPETARVKVNTSALLKGVIPLAGHDNLYVLQPVDMLLHSATHLFHEGDFEKGLRDLFDLDSLFREFGVRADFWHELVPRAVELGLTRPLYYAIRYTTAMLETPVPKDVENAAMVGKPPAPIAWLMDVCYMRALRALHPSNASLGNWLARFTLYVRSHWIRMPFHLLAYHLGRKAFVRPKAPEAPDLSDANQKVMP